MEPATASVVLTALIIIITVFGTLRFSKISVQLQQSTYRQKVGEELTALSSLLTQCQLLSQREQQRNDLVEVEAKRLLLHSPNDPGAKESIDNIKHALDLVNVRKSDWEEENKNYNDLRTQISSIWKLDQPNGDLLAEVQKLKAIHQSTLLRLQELDPTLESSYKKFMEQAAAYKL
jgi:hypothetical protein